MKDIVKQFKESISKLTPEEFKKIWDEIESEIGTDYPVFNAKSNCFEYKINNTETLENIEQAIENYLDSSIFKNIDYNEEWKNKLALEIEEEIKQAFKAGVEFTQKWVDINKEPPQYYQTVLADNGEYMAVVARVSDGDEEYYPICGTDIIMSPNPIKWRPIDLK